MSSSATAIPPQRKRNRDCESDSRPTWIRESLESEPRSRSLASVSTRPTSMEIAICDPPETGLPVCVSSIDTKSPKISLEDVARFVGQYLHLARAGKPRVASDLVFDFFDDRFEAGEFADCELAIQLINNVKFSDLSDTVLVAVLAATYPARKNLASRSVLVDHIHSYLVSTNGRDEADFIANSYR